MNRDLRNAIVQHLLKKGNYEPTVDDYLIDILIDNIQYAEMAQKDVKDNGLIVTIPNGNGIATTKENPAFGTYEKCLRHIHQASEKLCITRNDRIKLKLLEEKTKDEFDHTFN
jgi:P27 family predicted phage terminase small subunit